MHEGPQLRETEREYDDDMEEQEARESWFDIHAGDREGDIRSDEGHDEACEKYVFVAAEAADHREEAEQHADREDDLGAAEPLRSIRCETSQGR